MVKNLTHTLMLLFATLVFTASAFAESGKSFAKLTGGYLPSQNVSAQAATGQKVNTNIDNSFAAYAEIGKYTKNGWASLGFEAGFENIKAFSPAPGIHDSKIQIMSLMAKACGNIVNKSKFTPFGCGAVGLNYFDPSFTTGSFTQVDMDSGIVSAFSLEAGVKYAFNDALSLGGGYRYNDTFGNPSMSISGVPGSGVDVDLSRHMVFVQVEF